MNGEYIIACLVSFLLFPALLLFAKLEANKQDIKQLENENKELQKRLRKSNSEIVGNNYSKRLATIRDKFQSVYLPNKEWDNALSDLQTYTDLAPDDSFGWFYAAYVLHELKRTDEAIETMQHAIANLKDDNRMHTARINMACYECSLGNLEQAKNWLLEAKRLEGADYVRKHVNKDDELAALRAWVRFI